MINIVKYLLIMVSFILISCTSTNSLHQRDVSANSKNMDINKEITPENIVNQWLTFAKEQNWKEMANISQLTWASKKGSNASEEISWNYDFFEIKSWKIISLIKTRDTFYTVKVEIDTQLGKKIMEANVIKEISPYQESINGKWGINPTSAMFH